MGFESELQRFELEYCKGRNLSEKSTRKYLTDMELFSRFLSKTGRTSFFQAEKKDFADYLGSLKLKQSTIEHKKLTFKIFYNSFGKGSMTDWLKVKNIPIARIEPEDCISGEEFLKLLGACRTQRDRCILQLLMETGARVSEILSLKMKDVHFGRDSVFIDIKISKTIPRKIYLFDSVPDLKNWIGQHPQGPDAPLFTVKGGKQMNYWAFRAMLKLIAGRAGIKRRIHPHLFRHTRASLDAKTGMNSPLANKKFGWAANSNMFNRYSHLSDRDVADWDMEKRGLKVEKTESELKAKECPRCRQMNPWTSTFCGTCGMSLEKKDYKTLEKLDLEVEEIEEELKQHPKYKQALKEVILKRMKKKKQG